MMASLSYVGLSDRGLIRARNEDRWFADAEQGPFLVADGMGGGPAGELAAEIVVNALPNLLQKGLAFLPIAGRTLGFDHDRVRILAAPAFLEIAWCIR